MVVSENCNDAIGRVTDAQVSVCKRDLPSLVELEAGVSNSTAQKLTEVREKHSSTNLGLGVAEVELTEVPSGDGQNGVVKVVEVISRVLLQVDENVAEAVVTVCLSP